jgi:enoyl-CoA hydratase/carnithine racemase
MPFWKIDKYIRQLLGPNPFRAHDAIGAAGANFLTWSCLAHLAEKYGEVFRTTPELDAHKDTGQNWYPPNHFRPLVDWKIDAAEDDEFQSWILGPLFQMTSLMLHEERAHLSHMNTIGEQCAQFSRGILAVIRGLGPEAVVKRVEAYHALQPRAAECSWYPSVFERMGDTEWQQLYVNAEHDGSVGVVTLSRESYNSDVDTELNRALDWLKARGVEQMILSGDFHLSTQLVGADTSEFFPALQNVDDGVRIAGSWSRTARRLNDDFAVSVGFVNGKRCLGGMLELLTHCHYLVSEEGATLGMPEVTLPVVPGMEGCHWPFRKTGSEGAVGWLIDYAGPREEALKKVWSIATDGDHGLPRRELELGAMEGVPTEVGGLPDSGDPATEAARRAIMDSIQSSCRVTLNEALGVQTRLSAEFMTTSHCKKGRVGAEFAKMTVT